MLLLVIAFLCLSLCSCMESFVPSLSEWSSDPEALVSSSSARRRFLVGWLDNLSAESAMVAEPCPEWIAVSRIM